MDTEVSFHLNQSVILCSIYSAQVMSHQFWAPQDKKHKATRKRSTKRHKDHEETAVETVQPGEVSERSSSM